MPKAKVVPESDETKVVPMNDEEESLEVAELVPSSKGKWWERIIDEDQFKSSAGESTDPDPKKLPVCWTWMGLQYTGTSQVLLQLPTCITVFGFLGSVLMSYKPRELRIPVQLSSISWYINCLFISVPCLITVQHYAAARHALEVAREISKAALKDRKIAVWSASEVKKAKVEGSRLGITAFSLYGLMPMIAILVFIGAMRNMGSSAANNKMQLTILALGLTAFVLIAAGSVHVMVRGLLRRERDNTVNYVTFSLEPTFISLLCFQFFFACVGMFKELTVPSAPGEPADLRRRCQCGR